MWRKTMWRLARPQRPLRFDELPRNLALLLAHRKELAPIISHRFPVSELAGALELFMSGATGTVSAPLSKKRAPPAPYRRSKPRGPSRPGRRQQTSAQS